MFFLLLISFFLFTCFASHLSPPSLPPLAPFGSHRRPPRTKFCLSLIKFLTIRLNMQQLKFKESMGIKKNYFGARKLDYIESHYNLKVSKSYKENVKHVHSKITRIRGDISISNY